ncbi:GntR family transcriptional regulator [Hutsoniella sourekii]|uniref:GntR family transcriptional regulator n=1 Tax=Hutsoniella sourekii TaxID=87650 RepID=UPI0004842559|nr:GntR family transcriptional regulator [Hutsoniella sourekii]
MTLKDQAYHVLRQEIVTQKLEPGTPLKELDVAERLKMSRTPVREAIKRLVQEGLAVSYSSRSTFVSKINPKDVEEIFTVRTALELLALQISFDKISQREIENIQVAYQDLQTNFSYQAAYDLDLSFHNLWILNSDNQRLISILKFLDGQFERYRRYSHQVKARSQASIDEHLIILGYIQAKNLEAAEKALKDHLDNTKYNIEKDVSTVI